MTNETSVHESETSAPVTWDATLATTTAKSLRWWPAAVILALMLLVKLIPNFWESPPLPVMMIGFLGPASLAMLLPLWWLFFSRGTISEKWLGLVGILGIAGLTIGLVHFSMAGMSVMLFQIPVGLAAFAIALILFYARPKIRLIAAMVATVAGFGFWDLLQMRGTTGSFAMELDWRWTPTAEDRYLMNLHSETRGRADRAADSVDAVPVSRQTAEWPDFRGRHRDGVVEGVAIATDWEQSPPKLIWKALIGPGWSSFTIAGNRLFTQEQRGEKEAVVCLDCETGKSIWASEHEDRFWEAMGGAGPRATPTIGDGVLYALGADGHLSALSPIDGQVIWTRELRADSGREPPMWGWASSPLIAGEYVVVHAGGPGDKGVLAYDTQTGEPGWSVASGDHSYSSAQLATIGNRQGILMVTNRSVQFLGVDDGATIWEHFWEGQNYRALQPLVMGDSVFISTSLGLGTRRVDVKLEGDQWKVAEAWTSLGMKPDFNDYVAFNGYLYGFDGNIFACINTDTGKRAWKRGRYGNGQVLLLEKSGQLLVLSERGELVLLAADPNEWKELGSMPAIEGKTWNHAVMVANRVYVRNGQEAACYELATQ